MRAFDDPSQPIRKGEWICPVVLTWILILILRDIKSERGGRNVVCPISFLLDSGCVS